MQVIYANLKHSFICGLFSSTGNVKHYAVFNGRVIMEKDLKTCVTACCIQVF
jgi:hypothetical protein